MLNFCAPCSYQCNVNFLVDIFICSSTQRCPDRACKAVVIAAVFIESLGLIAQQNSLMDCFYLIASRMFSFWNPRTVQKNNYRVKDQPHRLFQCNVKCVVEKIY
uniref:Uncharacterized protein n=1 Tax=Pyxicephalus adspersus TaxID=30357 RepID=A0AAV2ZIC1_PYXAD|nr:TPA: hypothetical protein GDO54_002699 [Pyxicephalus adspersus]